MTAKNAAFTDFVIEHYGLVYNLRHAIKVDRGVELADRQNQAFVKAMKEFAQSNGLMAEYDAHMIDLMLLDAGA